MHPIVSILFSLLSRAPTDPPVATTDCPSNADGPYPAEWNITNFLYLTYDEPLSDGSNTSIGQVSFMAQGGYSQRLVTCFGNGPEYIDYGNGSTSPWTDCPPADGLPAGAYNTSFQLVLEDLDLDMSEVSICGSDPEQLSTVEVTGDRTIWVGPNGPSPPPPTANATITSWETDVYDMTQIPAYLSIIPPAPDERCTDASLAGISWELDDLSYDLPPTNATITAQAGSGLIFRMRNSADHYQVLCMFFMSGPTLFQPIITTDSVANWHDCVGSDVEATDYPPTSFRLTLDTFRLYVNQSWVCDDKDTAHPYVALFPCVTDGQPTKLSRGRITFEGEGSLVLPLNCTEGQECSGNLPTMTIPGTVVSTSTGTPSS